MINGNLIGSLLGDGSLYKYKNMINSGLAIGRSLKDLEYLKYQYNIFKDFCSSNIVITSPFDKRTNKSYDRCFFRTQSCKIFNDFRQKWYNKNIKFVPKDLKLTPLICAIWFCDDGSSYVSQSGYVRLSLYTDGFIKNDVEFLAKLLQCETGAKLSITRKNHCKNPDKGYYIYTYGDGYNSILKYIIPVFPKSMNRKLKMLGL